MGRATIVDGNASAGSSEHEYSSAIQLSERIVYLAGEVTEQAIANVIATIVALANHDKTSPIKLIVSTYGGSVDEMFSLYDIIKFVPCPVHTIALGKVMSAGVLLVASGQKGNRLIGRSTRLMIHPISAGAEGSVFQMENDVTEYKRQQSLMEEMLLAETTMTKAQLTTIMKKGADVYLTAKEAVKFGIVDAIFKPREK